MIKVLAGLLAAAVIAAAAFFGFEFYVQQRAANEVAAAFAAVRESGAKASHGRVSYDLWSRTITVADIAGESAAQPPISVKIGKFTASGVRQAEAGRFSADRIEATDVDFDGTMPALAGARLTYKAPRIEIANYSGPAGPLRRLDPSVPADLHRFVFEHFAAVTAASVTAPSVTGDTKLPGDSDFGEYRYAGVAMRDIRDGRIASMTVDRVTFDAAFDIAGKQEKMTGEIADIVASDFDAAATLAMFDPARAKDDKVYRGYRQVKAGAYTGSFTTGMKFRIGAMTMDDIGVNPSKLQFPLLVAILEAMPPGTKQTTEQARDLLEKIAGLYEGIALGSAEVRGLSVEAPDGPVSLAALRLRGLEKGKLAEFSMEGLETQSPQGPVKIGRFALTSFDVANLVRASGQFLSRSGPAVDKLAGLLLVLEGTEIRNLVAPYKATGQPVTIDTLGLSWGQFVGPIPTRARATLKMSGPVEASDPEPFNLLAAAGMASASLHVDLGAAWNESTRAFALEPATLEIGSVLTAAARASFANVPSEVFSVNPLQAAIMAAQIEAGPLEIALRDNGGVELFVAQHARTQGLAREDARRALIAGIRATAMQLAAASPDAMAIAGALARFIESPGGTLTIKLTPRGRVAMMALVDTLRTDPMAALGRFQVDASYGR